MIRVSTLECITWLNDSGGGDVRNAIKAQLIAAQRMAQILDVIGARARTAVEEQALIEWWKAGGTSLSGVTGTSVILRRIRATRMDEHEIAALDRAIDIIENPPEDKT